MNEMIERIARALFAEEWGDAGNFDNESDDGRNYWRRNARVVLTVLREPTEAMIQAAHNAAGNVLEYPNIPILIWQAMIDEALK
jgi:hypothetical protein